MHHIVKSRYSHYFTTNDGVKLHYRVSGKEDGDVVVLLPGWTGDSSVFHRNYAALNEHFKVYALDYRCHGLSESPDYGLRISRLAMDVKELVDHAGIQKFSIIAHSMGNAVAWCYLSLFGEDRIRKIVIEDESPCLIANPEWTDEEDELYTGGAHKKNNFWDLVNATAKSWEAAFAIFGDYFPMHKPCPPFPEYHYEEADPQPVGLGELDNKKHAQLLQDHMTNDWRDVIPRIKSPVLVIAGEASHLSTPRTCKWYEEQLQDGRVVFISAEDFGVHEMHLYSPEIFNREVVNFLK